MVGAIARRQTGLPDKVDESHDTTMSEATLVAVEGGTSGTQTPTPAATGGQGDGEGKGKKNKKKKR
jgi:hypothetical protein